MTHGSLFSGIGGFDLAAEWMGWENKFHCEWNSFGQQVLKHYWPNAESFEDITKTKFTKYEKKIDVLTGGFPCQPYSLAGKRRGKDDERHLWPEMCRAINEIQPRWIVGENVFGLVNWSGGLVFHEVQADLEAAGYEVWPYVLPAASVNAPHRRDRVWFVAHSKDNGRDGRECEQRQGIESNKWDICEREAEGRNEIRSQFERHCQIGTFTDTISIGFGKSGFIGKNEPGNYWQTFPTVSPICDGNDGISNQLAGITFSKWRQESIKAAGNAIVPQVALQIFKAIEEYENLNLGTG